MIVSPILIFPKYNSLYYLRKLTFPDFEKTIQLAHYLRDEWTMPPDLLKDFSYPEGAKVQYRVPGITRSPQGDTANMLIFITDMPSFSPAARFTMTEENAQIINLISKGLNNKQIALRMNRSRRWVQYRLAEIKRHFKVDTVEQLSTAAFRDKVLRSP